MKEKFKNLSDETKNFIIVFGAVIITVIIFFLITNARLNRPYTINVPNKFYQTAIQYDEILIGSIFKMPEDSYYVWIYEQNDPRNELFRYLLETNENGLRHYRANLDSFFSNQYRTEESNIMALEFSQMTILLIEDGKIKNYWQEKEEIFDYFNK